MNFKKTIILILLGVSAMIFGGCNNEGNENSSVPPTVSDTNTETPNDENTGGSIQPDSTDDNVKGTNSQIDANQLYENMSLHGKVAEFTDDGCSVIPIISEEAGDGMVGQQAAPGYEDTETYVTVSYSDDCIFQIADIDVATEKAVLSNTSREDIKKQTTLMLYGEYQDTYHLNVSKVIIQRIGGGSQ